MHQTKIAKRQIKGKQRFVTRLEGKLLKTESSKKIDQLALDFAHHFAGLWT